MATMTCLVTVTHGKVCCMGHWRRLYIYSADSEPLLLNGQAVCVIMHAFKGMGLLD